MAIDVKENRKEEMIQRIKDCGQYIIDNAADILGDEKYIRDLYLRAFPQDADIIRAVLHMPYRRQKSTV